MLAAETQLKALMLVALAGDKVAYRGLLATLGRQLRSYYARRLGRSDANAEDLVQETLIAIHTKRDTYDPAQPFTPWLYAIARYKLMDHLRRCRIRAAVPLEHAAEMFAQDDTEGALAKRDLERVLEALPESSRDLVRKVKLEGLTTAEAAARTGRSEIAVRVGLHRSLKALSEKFRQRGDRGDS